MTSTIRFRTSTIVTCAAVGGLSVLGTLGLDAAMRPPLAIQGYDPVAYFADGEPKPGHPDYAFVWAGVRWQFVDGDHLARFAVEPERYTPRIHRFCALAPALGPADAGVDPNLWSIVDGRLYLNRPRIDQMSAIPVPDGGP